MRYTIIQPRIPHYRVPFFDRLGQCLDGELRILHSGSNVESTSVAFEEEIVPKIEAGVVENQWISDKNLKRSDVIVAPINVRTLSNVWLGVTSHSQKLLYWGHGLGTSYIANRLRRWLFTRADGVILYGEEGHRKLESIGIPASKLFVAPNTIDVPNAGFDPETPRRSFLFVGRLQRRKRIDLLLRNFAKVQDDLPGEISIEIVGEGEIGSELKQLAKTLGISDRTTFWGRIVDDTKLKQIFHRSLAYVSPGHVGLGTLHSFAYGIPVVTQLPLSRHSPEVHNIDDGQTGILYNPKNTPLTSILVRFSTSDVSFQFGRAAYKYYNTHRRLDQMVSGFLDALNFIDER
jgi:glycosyltransferase involved in cell wall biosynthesis